MIGQLNGHLARENDAVAETDQSVGHPTAVLGDLRKALKAAKRQRIRDIMKHPAQEQLLQETHGKPAQDCKRKSTDRPPD